MNELEMVNEQIALELSAIDEAREAYDRRLKEGRPLPPHFTLVSTGLEMMTKEIETYQNSKTAGRRNGQIRVQISQIDPQELAFVVLWTAVTELGDEINATKAASLVGRAVESHLEYVRFKEGSPEFLRALEKKLQTSHSYVRKTAISKAAKKAGLKPLAWDDETRCHVGAKMLDLMFSGTGMYQRQHGKTKDGNNRQVIRPSDETCRFLEKAHEKCSLAHPLYKPCIIPPRPWTNLYDGGFHSRIGRMKLCLVKSRMREVRDELEKADMEQVYRTVNALQDTAFRVNRRVLEVVQRAWEMEEDFGVLPKVYPIELPERPWGSEDELERLKVENPGIVRDWIRRAATENKRLLRVKPKYRAASNTISRAVEFKDRDRFFFCYQVDFRGRCYPVQLFLQPQGDDLCKGLLEFADAVPLGEHGHLHLAIHGANSYGNKVDKLSIEEKIEWVRQHDEQILDSAQDPIAGDRFWAEAEEPWQFLAFCFEWADYLNAGTDMNFLSHLPVSVDGSCNGLQHMAALMRDENLARAVNMLPSERPNDVYGDVARNLEKIVEADLTNQESFKVWTDESGKEITLKCCEMAKLWHGHIDRSLVKHNVMTLPYGVTAAGMREQLMEELQKRLDKDPQSLGALAELDERMQFKAVLYLAERVKIAIGGIAGSAFALMDWLKHVAGLFNDMGRPMKWTTPTGFRVVQRYVKPEIVGINTYWGKQRIKLALIKDTEELDGRKQVAGFVPNLIHSLDASHLMLTVNGCKDEGVDSFAMVHDSFGTHAGHMHILGRVLREQFIRIYTGDALQNFLERMTD